MPGQQHGLSGRLYSCYSFNNCRHAGVRAVPAARGLMQTMLRYARVIVVGLTWAVASLAVSGSLLAGSVLAASVFVGDKGG
jgi:hypothetical protein